MPTVTKRSASKAKADACCASVLAAPLAEADARELAHGYAALADPVRLRLLSLIALRASAARAIWSNRWARRNRRSAITPRRWLRPG